MSRLRKILPALVFLCGFCLCAFPQIQGRMQAEDNAKEVEAWRQSLKECESRQTADVLKEADRWNAVLVGTGMTGLDTSLAPYTSQLDISGTGLMGCLEIPQIAVSLPIRHGTAEETISSGIGHVETSALPCGGTGTRSVLTSHRGLPGARLFTRLDELKPGVSTFTIEVPGRTLTYRVYETLVLTPEEAEKLEPVPGKDVCTLLTCTPFGINSHRLVVNAERIENAVTAGQEQKEGMPSIRELVFRVLPPLLLLLFILVVIRQIRQNRKSQNSKEENNEN